MSQPEEGEGGSQRHEWRHSRTAIRLIGQLLSLIDIHPLNDLTEDDGRNSNDDSTALGSTDDHLDSYGYPDSPHLVLAYLRATASGPGNLLNHFKIYCSIQYCSKYYYLFIILI